MERSKISIHRIFSLAFILPVAMIFISGCSFGTKGLKDGHLAYNEATRISSDQELLLNIVRLRYLDTIEFLAINSISAQLSFSVSIGGTTGKETGRTTNLGIGEVAWSNRPTFTFTPHRGKSFANTLMTPVPLPILHELISSDWSIEKLFRMLVQNVNGLNSSLGLVSDDFIEFSRLIGQAQTQSEIYFGTVLLEEKLSGSIPVSQVSGADLVEAAKAGYRFQENSTGDKFVLMRDNQHTTLYFLKKSLLRERLLELIHLDSRNYDPIVIREGVQPDILKDLVDYIAIDTRSVLNTLSILAGGVKIPESHLNKGMTVEAWGVDDESTQEIFSVKSSQDKPSSNLAVKYRNHWFYIPENDLESKETFLLLAELLRLALSIDESNGPVLTLPLGVP